jgi:RimJ/RimL family protein N-acetyltransferase
LARRRADESDNARETSMLRGKRVVLRAMEKDDLKRLHDLYANVDLVLLGHAVWRPEPLTAWEKDFDKHLEDSDKSDFVIVVDGVVIGQIGLQSHHMNRRAGVAYMGVGIYDPEYVGKGYGRDAILTLLDWSFRILNLRRIALDTLATNERAIRAYRACGFVEEGRLREHEYVDGAYVDTVTMGILRSEWEKAQRG